MLDLLPLHGQNFDFKVYSNLETQNSEEYKSGNIYQKDLLLFINILEESHPELSPQFNSSLNIDSIKNEAYKWTFNCTSDAVLKSYMQSIATLLHDGHTSLIPEFNQALVYPFIFFKDKQDIYLRGINKEYSSSLGKKILQINGYPVLDVINSYRPVISSDNENYFLDKVNDFMQLYSIWKNHPYCMRDSTLHLTFEDTTSIELHPISKQQLNIVWKQSNIKNNSIRQNSKQPFLYNIDSVKNICYLQFNSCVDQSSLRLQYYMKSNNSIGDDLEKKILAIPRFDTFLKEMFEDIRVKSISTLVIDVRNNAGGDSRLCNTLLSWLKPQKDIKPVSSFIRFSKLWELNYPILADEYKYAFAELQEPYEMGKLYNSALLPKLSSGEKNSSIQNKIDELFLINNDENLVFKGKVIFIQNSKTYSSAGLLVTTATDNNIGIVIGDESSYSPCSFGDILAWMLPNTNIRGIVSHKIFKRPDTTRCNLSSLVPSVYLHSSWADVIENKDICWDWILDNK